LHEIVIPEGFTEISQSAFFRCSGLQKLVITSNATDIMPYAFKECNYLEFVHLPAGLSNIAINSFESCPRLKAIYVPKGNVDFYKERFPSDMHWLIVEEGSDLPTKAENFMAKDVTFAPALRIIVPKGETDSYIVSAAMKRLENWPKEKIIKWIIDNHDTITDSKEAYNEKDC
jgi:hypothetical protein